jgi:hypothetical protein
MTPEQLTGLARTVKDDDAMVLIDWSDGHEFVAEIFDLEIDGDEVVLHLSHGDWADTVGMPMSGINIAAISVWRRVGTIHELNQTETSACS